MPTINISDSLFDQIKSTPTDEYVTIKGPGSQEFKIPRSALSLPTYTEIAVLLDESSSMGPLTESTISGFNEVLNEQQKFDGKATLTVAKFHSGYSYIYEDVDLQSAAELTKEDYVPQGMTRLLDGIGYLTTKIEDKINKMPQNERPHKVLITIITDGHENCSSEWNTPGKIKERIQSLEKKGWEFVFIGANQDAVMSAANLGINASNAINYGATQAGVKGSYKAVSYAMSNVRGLVSGEDGSLFTNKLKAEVENTVDVNKAKTTVINATPNKS